MGAAIMPSTDVPVDSFWDRLRVLQAQHQSLQHEQEQLARALDDTTFMLASDDLRDAWKQYCRVIADLESTAEKFGSLRPEWS